MPFLQDHPRIKGISLPPSGWVLAALLAIYIFTGLVGHDPWKHDDAISIGVAFDVFAHGNWLAPQLAGQPYPDAPLYYWVAASTAHLFSWLLPTHDAVRLASGLFTLLALQFILLAARELHGREQAAAAPLLLAGSIGFLFHAHEAQPMLAALAAHAAVYWSLVLLPRRPRQATLALGASIALGFLANGVLPVITLAPAILLTVWQTADRRKISACISAGLVLALAIVALWLVPLQGKAPDYLAALLRSEFAPLWNPVNPLTEIPRYLNLLLWYAWPALPLAAWALWPKRRVLRSREIALPGLSFVAVLLILGVLVELRSSAALLLLPPLVLLAVPGVGTLRRGAANAFDWFGMMTFTFFLVVCWIVWSAMVFGWPARLARQAVRLEPGFVGQFNPLAFGFALLLSLIWFWIIATSPRSPMRGIMHWMTGLTLFWVLVATLWMPWIDYGKTYRSVSANLAKAIPARADCVASANLPDSVLGTLDYFNGIRTVPASSAAAKNCHWLVMHGDPRDPQKMADAGWRKVWEGARPSDRRSGEKIRLYRRAADSGGSSVGDLRFPAGDSQRKDS
ncbi:MAG: glycosyltransferase family 39 protein [Propionivibrio sp.]